MASIRALYRRGQRHSRTNSGRVRILVISNSSFRKLPSSEHRSRRFFGYLDQICSSAALEGKGKEIGAAVWKDGVREANRDGFIALANRLPANAPKTLIVLQPRVTSSEHDRCWGGKAAASHSLRVKQIDTLMLSARVSALSCGAMFVGIGDAGA